jgi:hypothetical protein
LVPRDPHFSRDVLARIANTFSDSNGRPLMKAFAAVVIAAAILYAIDSEYNDARYTRVVAQAVSSVIPR